MFKVVHNTNRLLWLGVGGCQLHLSLTMFILYLHLFTILIILDDTCNKPEVDIVGNLLEKTLIQWNVC